MKIIFFAGGSGTRFWPISRKKMPKQFIPVIGDKSTFELHLEKFMKYYTPDDIFVATTDILVDKVNSIFPYLREGHLIVEPCRRDVGASVGLDMTRLRKLGFENEPVIGIWADNFIGKMESFHDALVYAENRLKADPNMIFTMGQIPSYPNENLGWIELTKQLEKGKAYEVYEKKEFKYRPSLEQATQWFNGGNSLWNMGYFISTPKFILSKYEQNSPEMYAQLCEIENAYGTENEKEVLNRIYPQIEKLHFDNIVPEKVTPQETAIIGGDFEWDDPGTLYALKQFIEKSPDRNATKGAVHSKDTKDSLIYNYVDGQLVATVGLDGFIVVNTKDAVLVCPKDRVGDVKKMVEEWEGKELEGYL